MSSPATPPRSPDFHTLLNDSLAARETAAYALKSGVLPARIVDYVRKRLHFHEQELVTAQAAQHPWVMGRIVALVKSARNPLSLGNRLLESKGEIRPHVWGVKETVDRDADFATLLDQVK